ncbi:MAG: hypothetical protein IJZ46_04430 [Bacilli bacterium]|nr:hypothetical protein [Bacilli bacterium]
MSKTNRFHVKEFEDNRITVEEQRKNRSKFILFFRKNGNLIFIISLLFSLTVFIIALSLTISNIKDSSIVMYESNGVIVSFDETDNSILNGLPITKEYAIKVFESNTLEENNNRGAVIKIKEVNLTDRKIVFYSDKTALIKYTNGEYLRVYAINNNYGITEDGIIDRNTVTKKVTGQNKTNDSLNIKLLYLSDGSIEVTKDNTVLFVRNSDITSNSSFYTNLSIVSVPVKAEENKIYYSKGTIKEDNYIIVDGKKYSNKEEKVVLDDIKIIYYENGFAEVIKGDLSIIVEDSNHIRYDDNIFEIIDNDKEVIEIKDVMDIKNINLKNTNTTKARYLIVIEETDNYEEHNIVKRLDTEYIYFNIDVNGNKINNNILNNNLKDNNDTNGLILNNNTYLLYEGILESLEEVSIKLGMWISYEKITNEYMNSAFIGTVKVYVEEIN